MQRSDLFITSSSVVMQEHLYIEIRSTDQVPLIDLGYNVVLLVSFHFLYSNAVTSGDLLTLLGLPLSGLANA